MNGVFSDAVSALVTFVCIGIAVTMFIINGNRMETYKQLLQEGEYKAERKQDKLIEAAAAVVWPLALVIYLVWSFYTKRWDYTWIIWPVMAILFWIFSAVVSIVRRKEIN